LVILALLLASILLGRPAYRATMLATGVQHGPDQPGFYGIRGTVVALDRATGSEVWRSELKGKDFVNVVLQDGDLYATTKGELFRLDSATGEILCQNPLKGLGWGLITIAATGSQQAVVIREKGQRDEAAAAAASNTATMV
jgi:outer membrane protein assembly factor BamB